MAIKKIPEKGLEIELDDFVKLRAFQTGGEFWGHEHQSVIREHLDGFLPRMEVQSDGKTVLAQHFVGGKEVASKSNQASNGIPKSERKRLELAVSRLRERAADKNADQTTKSIIEAFKLPDPNKDPELYRVYGSRFKPKLLVLWGCEKEAGSSIVPDAAPAKIKDETAGLKFTRNLPWFLVILLIASLGYYGYSSGTFDDLLSKKGTEVAANSDTPDGEGEPGTDPGAADGELASAGSKDGNEGAPEAAEGSSPEGQDGDSSDENGKGPEKDADGNLIAGGSGDASPSTGNTEDSSSDEETDLENQEPADPEQDLMVEEPDPEADEPDATRERAADGDLVNLAKITRSAVVLIAVGDQNGDVSGTGSGFLISPDGLVATNYHVLKNASQAVAKLADGNAFRVDEVIVADKQKDLAVFRIDTGSDELPYLALDEGAGADVGLSIAVIGSPLGLEGTFTVGIVSSKRKMNDVDHIQITAPISPGSSGSPVVDYDGIVVGVAVGAIEAGQALNFAIDVSELHDLLNDNGGSDGLLESTDNTPLNKMDPEELPSGAEWGGGGVVPETVPTPPSSSPQDPDKPLLAEETEVPQLPGAGSSPDKGTTGPSAPSEVPPETVPTPPSSSPQDPDKPLLAEETEVPQLPGAGSSPDKGTTGPSAPSEVPPPAGDSTHVKNPFRIVQIEKEETSSGKVEITLELQQSDGSPVTANTITWKLDGKATESAKPSNGRFTYQIEQGDHTLSVEGETTAGEKINIHASMNIEVEVRSAIEIRHLEDQ